jgi:antitoxin VapB
MVDSGKVAEERARWNAEVRRVSGSAPWMKAKEVRHYRAKVFKSGNSLALRLPAGLGLSPGQEMDLRVEHDDSYSFAPIDRPPRKFNIDRVWGSAAGLEPIKPEDRLFDERSLINAPRGRTDRGQ